MAFVGGVGSKSGVVAFKNVSYDEKLKKSPNSSEVSRTSFDEVEGLLGRWSASEVPGRSPTEGQLPPAVYKW